MERLVNESKPMIRRSTAMIDQVLLNTIYQLNETLTDTSSENKTKMTPCIGSPALRTWPYNEIKG